MKKYRSIAILVANMSMPRVVTNRIGLILNDVMPSMANASIFLVGILIRRRIFLHVHILQSHVYSQ